MQNSPAQTAGGVIPLAGIESSSPNVPVIVFYVDESQERVLSYQVSNLFDVAATVALTPGITRKTNQEAKNGAQ